MIKQAFTVPLEDQYFIIWALIAALFIISLIIQLVYIFRFYIKLPKYRKLNEKMQEDPVSVIICAKNEADNLKKFLPSVLNQIYPEFEVIVVNDGSTDDTEEVLADFKKSYSHLYVTGIEGKRGYVTGKKVAQTLGIKAAKYDQLILTEPCCEPLSPYWIRRIQSNFLRKTDIVLGYGGYKSRKGTLNRWIRTDSLYTAMQYLSFAINGLPIMGAGRNLAYRKSMFFDKKGFAKHLHIKAGDDDLFVNENANIYNTAIEIHPDSHTLCEPASSWKIWFREKRHVLSARPLYKKKHRRILSLETASRELLFLASTILLVFWKFPAYVLILLLLREISFMLTFKQVMKLLNEKNLLVHSLIYDIFWPLIAGYLKFRNRFSPKIPIWK